MTKKMTCRLSTSMMTIMISKYRKMKIQNKKK